MFDILIQYLDLLENFKYINIYEFLTRYMKSVLHFSIIINFNMFFKLNLLGVV